MMKKKLLQRVDELIEMGNAVLRTRRAVNRSQQLVDKGAMAGFRSASQSFIKMAYDQDHPHYVQFSESTNSLFPSNVESGLAILKVVRGEIAGDWLFTVKGLVAAEFFTDYLAMAEHLLESGYKDAAAVITGSTLEEHLRQLCRKNNIPITQEKNGKDVPLKADQLNSDLTRGSVYTMLDQKQVTAWLDLRNKAAHGNYGEYNAEQVKGMITSITEFMARVAV
jgi:hypothetical protein